LSLVPYKDGRPVGHGRFNPRAKGDGYIGKVVNGSISQRDTLGCFSPAVDSSHPTYMIQGKIDSGKKSRDLHLTGNLLRMQLKKCEGM
jgi:hypothetical protein